MTPREVQLTIRADAERGLDEYDRMTVAAWQGARWGRVKPSKFPHLKDVLAKRKSQRIPLTMEQDIARFQHFFSRIPKGKVN